ncbi:MAG TPA: Hpt domain-containing protein [Bacillota bacterium]|nr:Hpt domain-containing protein [Bacillota bacterium]HPE37929.1 Hpt domain-containing protein [Bacillota bacterium]
MGKALLQRLAQCETDVDGALQRFSEQEALYLEIVRAFPNDETMDQLANAIAVSDWDGAFTAAHALKGLAGNLGFIPLFHEVGSLVMLIRAGREEEIDVVLKRVSRCYQDLVDTINEDT